MSHAIEIRDLVKEYKTGQPVLKGINLDIDDTGMVAVIGPSGTGKSTLIRCINRLVDPTRGDIWFSAGGKRTNLAQVTGRALRDSRREIGMVFQEYNLVERLTVMENLLCGRLGYTSAWRAWRRKFEPDDVRHAFDLLDTVGLGAFANQRADALSGGQRQRVGIARALMQRPRLLLADEPTSSLDPKTSFEIMSLLKEQGRAQGIPVMVNIHDVELARRYADRVIGMSGGQVVYDGSAANLNDECLKQIYGGEDWLS